MTTDLRDDDIRDLLRDLAAEMPLYGPETPAAVRRGKRRLLRNGVAGVVVVAVIAGAGLGAARLFHPTARKVPVVNPAPSETPTSQAQGDLVTIPVGEGPAAVAFGEGAAWVANADAGTVSRIDPSTNRVVATIDVGSGRYLELAVGEGAVWVANPGPGGGSAKRIDPATNLVVASIPVEHASEIVAGAGAVWVSNYEDGTVTKIDPRTNSVVDTIPVSGLEPHGLAVEGGSVWVLIDDTGSIDRIDPVTDAVAAGVSVGEGGTLAAGAGSVWAIGPNYVLLRIDPATNSVTSIGPVWKAGERYQLDVAATPGTVWVLTPESMILVDPTTNAIVGTVPRGGFASAAGAGSAWIIGDEGAPNAVLRVEPGSAVPTPPAPTPTGPSESPPASPPAVAIGLVDAQSASTTLHVGDTLDFDTGKENGSGADVTWSPTELDPAGGSYLANVTGQNSARGPGALSFDRLRVAPLSSYIYRTSALDGTAGPGDQLAPGKTFGVWTVEGRYAKARVLSRVGGNLEIAWVTYSFGSSNPCRFSGSPAAGATGAIVSRSDSFTLCGTHLFDFDTGTSADTAPDIAWEQVSDVVRRIEAGPQLLANLGAVDFDSLSLADLQALSYGEPTIDGNDDSTNQLVPGDVFAVATSDGNHAKVEVLGYGYNLQIRFVTYRG